MLSNQRTFLDYLARKLKITDQSMWYTTLRSALEQYQGRGLLTKYKGSLLTMMKTIYPEYHATKIAMDFL